MNDGTTEVADLEAQLADATAAIAALEPLLAAAERERETADRVHQAALRAHQEVLGAAYAAESAFGMPGAAPPEVRAGRLEELRAHLRASEGAAQQADEEVQAALVRLNAVGQRRGAERMRIRRIEAALAEAREQAASEQRMQASDPGRALLERIKSSLAG